VILLSSLVAFELWYGRREKASARKATPSDSRHSLQAPSNGRSSTTKTREQAGTIRAELEAAGKPIGAYDVLSGRSGATTGCDARDVQLERVHTSGRSEVGRLGDDSPRRFALGVRPEIAHHLAKARGTATTQYPPPAARERQHPPPEL